MSLSVDMASDHAFLALRAGALEAPEGLLGDPLLAGADLTEISPAVL